MPLGTRPLSGLPISGNPPPPPEELAASQNTIADDAIVISFAGVEDFAGSIPSEEIAPVAVTVVEEPLPVATNAGEDFAGAHALDEHGPPPWTPREPSWLTAPSIAEDFAATLPPEESGVFSVKIAREPLPAAANVGEELPQPPTPPTPQPRVRTSSVEYAERKWQERWDEIASEHRVVEETGKSPWTPPPITEDESVVVLGPAAAVGKGIESEADYTILPVGDGAAVRAMASGWVQYTYRDRLGLCAALAGDDGVRYLYVGLGRPEGEPRHVGKGEVIGFTLTAAERETSTATHAELTEGGLVAEHPEFAPWTFDVTTRQAPPTWPRQAEVLLLGLPVAGVVIAIGAPLLGAAIGTATLIIAARRPK